jgi:ubiquinone/menaquinone biosynthesis C-methylase UbiE
MNKVIEFYQSYDEDSRLVRSRVKALEYQTTIEVLKSYTSGKQALLDVGAGTGRYALHYAELGLKVSAVEIVPEYAEIIRQKAHDNHFDGLEVVLADARNLQHWQDNTFDVVLCLGPLYHLRSIEERNACVEECTRVLSPGGVLALAYINQWFALAYYCKNRVFLEEEVIEKILKDDYDFHSDMDPFLNISHFTTPTEIEQELKAFPLKTLDHVATDGIYAMFGEAIEQMNAAEWQHWYAYHLKTCRSRDTLGYSNHGLVVCQKAAAA